MRVFLPESYTAHKSPSRNTEKPRSSSVPKTMPEEVTTAKKIERKLISKIEEIVNRHSKEQERLQQQMLENQKRRELAILEKSQSPARASRTQALSLLGRPVEYKKVSPMRITGKPDENLGGLKCETSIKKELPLEPRRLEPLGMGPKRTSSMILDAPEKFHLVPASAETSPIQVTSYQNPKETPNSKKVAEKEGEKGRVKEKVVLTPVKKNGKAQSRFTPYGVDEEYYKQVKTTEGSRDEVENKEGLEDQGDEIEVEEGEGEQELVTRKSQSEQVSRVLEEKDRPRNRKQNRSISHQDDEGNVKNEFEAVEEKHTENWSPVIKGGRKSWCVKSPVIKLPKKDEEILANKAWIEVSGFEKGREGIQNDSHCSESDKYSNSYNMGCLPSIKAVLKRPKGNPKNAAKNVNTMLRQYLNEANQNEVVRASWNKSKLTDIVGNVSEHSIESTQAAEGNILNPKKGPRRELLPLPIARERKGASLPNTRKEGSNEVESETLAERMKLALASNDVAGAIKRAFQVQHLSKKFLTQFINSLLDDNSNRTPEIPNLLIEKEIDLGVHTLLREASPESKKFSAQKSKSPKIVGVRGHKPIPSALHHAFENVTKINKDFNSLLVCERFNTGLVKKSVEFHSEFSVGERTPSGNLQPNQVIDISGFPTIREVMQGFGEKDKNLFGRQREAPPVVRKQLLVAENGTVALQILSCPLRSPHVTPGKVEKAEKTEKGEKGDKGEKFDERKAMSKFLWPAVGQKWERVEKKEMNYMLGSRAQLGGMERGAEYGEREGYNEWPLEEVDSVKGWDTKNTGESMELDIDK